MYSKCVTPLPYYWHLSFGTYYVHKLSWRRLLLLLICMRSHRYLITYVLKCCLLHYVCTLPPKGMDSKQLIISLEHDAVIMYIPTLRDSMSLFMHSLWGVTLTVQYIVCISLTGTGVCLLADRAPPWVYQQFVPRNEMHVMREVIGKGQVSGEVKPPCILALWDNPKPIDIQHQPFFFWTSHVKVKAMANWEQIQ